VTSIRAVVLIDGEHHPSVVSAGLIGLERRGLLPVAALFLGGSEKTAGPPDLTIPVHTGEPSETLRDLIARCRPGVVFDLSDEPVLDHRARFVLVGVALAAGVAYAGGGFRFDPPPTPHLTRTPSVAVVGTGKRTGKTAVSIALARHWSAAGRRPVVVTMGRGGPSEPVVLAPGDVTDPVNTLRELASRGLHAASDYVEDALFAGVPTVGTRRIGAGPAGVTVEDTFAAGVAAAESLDPGLLIFEGSGTAIPPARADASVLVMRSVLDEEYIAGYLGPFRLAMADAVVVINDGGSAAAVVRRVAPGQVIIEGRYTVEPTVTVKGKRVTVATTAPVTAEEELVAQLRSLGASTATVIHTLSNRNRLPADLEAAPPCDLVLTEVKAAAADVVLPWADRRRIDFGLIHNVVQLEGGIGYLAIVLGQRLAAAPEPQPSTR
jgi:cyclic 2,3-diphosphoglycerate synthetase